MGVAGLEIVGLGALHRLAGQVVGERDGARARAAGGHAVERELSNSIQCSAYFERCRVFRRLPSNNS